MKPIKISVIMAFFLGLTAISAQRYQEDKKLKFKETINKEYQFNTNSKNNILVVDNVYGSVEVEGYNGKKVQVEVIKSISADTKEDLEQGKKEIGVKSAKKDDALFVYLDSPYSHFDINTGVFDHREFSFNYRRKYKHVSKRMYKYVLDFKIKVPKETSLDIKAINNGDIRVENVHGKLLIVKNINGAIDMVNVSGKTDVNALNKDINISYAKNPTEESFYDSLNGDINIAFKEGLDATISYETLNGGLYTSFDVEQLQPQVQTIKQIKGKKTKYKVSTNKQFKIGNGKTHLHFNHLNGDVSIKK